MLFSPEDHARISAAIAKAEARTSGEIFAIVDSRPSRYRATSLTLAALLAFALPPLLAWAGLDPGELLRIGNDWSEGGATALRDELFAYSLLQLAIFLLALGLIALTPLERLLTPRATKEARARDSAMEQFLSKGLHVTAERTGVLIYVALADHEVEVVADEGIYAKVPPETWGDTVAAVVEGIKARDAAGGFVRAIGIAGDVLAAHFPPRPHNPNELPDHLIEL